MYRFYYLLQHNELASRNQMFCWLIFTDKSIIASCVLTILLVVDINGVGSTQCACTLGRNPRCQNGL